MPRMKSLGTTVDSKMPLKEPDAVHCILQGCPFLRFRNKLKTDKWQILRNLVGSATNLAAESKKG